MKPPERWKDDADENGFSRSIERDTVDSTSKSSGPQKSDGREDTPNPSERWAGAWHAGMILRQGADAPQLVTTP